MWLTKITQAPLKSRRTLCLLVCCSTYQSWSLPSTEKYTRAWACAHLNSMEQTLWRLSIMSFEQNTSFHLVWKRRTAWNNNFRFVCHIFTTCFSLTNQRSYWVLLPPTNLEELAFIWCQHKFGFGWNLLCGLGMNQTRTDEFKLII